MKKKFAFSLVELMISLIVISIVTAAFAPIVTKKLKTSDMSIGSSSSDYIFDESVCSTSIDNCSICLAGACVKCENGYYLDENKCKKCADNCTSCTNSSKCAMCKDGFTQNGSSCVSCSEKLRGCTKCSSNGTKCDTCVADCELCSSDKGCVKCKLGTYFNGKECVACTADISLATIGSYRIYRYNMGDECGPPISAGINICTIGQACPYSVNSPICYNASNVSSGYTASADKKYTYLISTRTVCNWYAYALATAGTNNTDILATHMGTYAFQLQLCAIGYGFSTQKILPSCGRHITGSADRRVDISPACVWSGIKTDANSRCIYRHGYLRGDSALSYGGACIDPAGDLATMVRLAI